MRLASKVIGFSAVTTANTGRHGHGLISSCVAGTRNSKGGKSTLTNTHTFDAEGRLVVIHIIAVRRLATIINNCTCRDSLANNTAITRRITDCYRKCFLTFVDLILCGLHRETLTLNTRLKDQGSIIADKIR
ncbi:hypothetical protein SIN8267_03438 [Sinobacterium norvegicum]|uniref:Secreted protein n=1 Tax=Sinobacterium norvegicum TaxID=1641715 RepID=A0ABN8ELM1_9GAMM|nr:hypothetical protein SIN8267_03438 [Sinobacterium norvegicum]